jgi:hypothetical protein
MNQSRLLYIDNLRIFLISLVVLHHLAITYGAPGDWYYNESEAGFPEVLFMSMFVASNQSFFMGFFFFISAFFILPSLSRKGTSVFVRDRLTRLGIPLFIFFFLISPLTVFLRYKFIENSPDSYLTFVINGWDYGFGPLWFVEALFLFTAVLLVFRKTFEKIKLKFPGTAKIVLFSAVTGLIQFIIRIWLPVGWTMPFTGFQFPFFVQYVFLFVFGIVAYQNGWLSAVSYETGKRWFIAAQILIFIGFPLLFFLGGAAENGDESFMGGGTGQSLSYALWEQITGISLMIGLTGIFKRYFNWQGIFAKTLSSSAYGVFVFHAPMIVGLSVLFASWAIFPPLKFILLAPVALVVCFVVTGLLKRIPGVNKVL